LLDSAVRCFDNYLGLVSQTYFGLPLQTLGKPKVDPQALTSALLSKKNGATGGLKESSVQNGSIEQPSTKSASSTELED
jgi:hypothetical protein